MKRTDRLEISADIIGISNCWTQHLTTNSSILPTGQAC